MGLLRTIQTIQPLLRQFLVQSFSTLPPSGVSISKLNLSIPGTVLTRKDLKDLKETSPPPMILSGIYQNLDIRDVTFSRTDNLTDQHCDIGLCFVRNYAVSLAGLIHQIRFSKEFPNGSIPSSLCTPVTIVLVPTMGSGLKDFPTTVHQDENLAVHRTLYQSDVLGDVQTYFYAVLLRNLNLYAIEIAKRVNGEDAIYDNGAVIDPKQIHYDWGARILYREYFNQSWKTIDSDHLEYEGYFHACQKAMLESSGLLLYHQVLYPPQLYLPSTELCRVVMEVHQS
ncbi:hypothetical protein DID73_00230 [Candidatus Marinamargulisbacteria bacterium SCGC AG-343-K17]|nr:hypothetical protein DID73_00230 [Candidatus Marinamargulisbacteria bacterium SCGC AG-343-K17]